MNAKEAYELSQSKIDKNTKSQYRSFLSEIEKCAKLGYSSCTYGLINNCDYALIKKQLEENGFTVKLTIDRIIINWSKQK